MEDNIKIMSERLKGLREERDLTQQDLADELDVSKSTYSYYESGKRNLNASTLLKLSNLYNVSLDYIMGLSDYRQTSEHYLKKLSNLNLNDELLKDEETINILNKMFNLSTDFSITKNKLKALLNVFHSLKHYIIISTEDI